MYHRTPLSFQIKKAKDLLIATLLGMLVLVSGYFFLRTTNSAEKGYLLRENQLRQSTLESDNRLLKQQLLQVQSINSLKGSNTVLNMQEPATTIYVEPKGPLTQRNK